MGWRDETEREGGLDLKDRTRSKRPRKYKVLLHNDDYTTMEFVVEVLMGVFSKTSDEAVRIMLDVHHNGTGLAGVYPKDVAETKAATAESMAQEEGFPFRCSTEPE